MSTLLLALPLIVTVVPHAFHAAPSPLESGVLAEINFVRAHPADYARMLGAYRDGFTGTIAHPGGDPIGIATHEGRAAVEDAIDFLARQRPIPPLGASPLLTASAGDLVADQGPRGSIGHLTRVGQGPGDRAHARGGDVHVSEVVAYGPPDPESVVRQLIVDDGVARRGHRVTLFSAFYRFAGIRCGAHRVHGSMCAIDLATTADGSVPPPTPDGSATEPQR